jgi:transcription initiation factor TFIID subunit 9B
VPVTSHVTCHTMSRAADTLPPTARAIALLLASTPTVQDAQPGVLHQLLEFAHRYTAQILNDALAYADHAGRAGKIELDDITLAVQARVGWELGGRIPKDVCSRVFHFPAEHHGAYRLHSSYSPLLLKQMPHHCLRYPKFLVSEYHLRQRP